MNVPTFKVFSLKLIGQFFIRELFYSLCGIKIRIKWLWKIKIDFL